MNAARAVPAVVHCGDESTCDPSGACTCFCQGCFPGARDDEPEAQESLAAEHERAHAAGPVDARACQGLGCPFGGIGGAS